MTEIKDYRVELRVKNNRLYTAILKTGAPNIAQFCKKHNIGTADVYNLMAMKTVPINKQGEFRPIVLKLAVACNVMPVSLFPAQHLYDAMLNNTASIDMSLEDVELLPQSMALALTDGRTPEDDVVSRELADALNDALSTLSPRERSIVEAKTTGDKTFAEIAVELGISSARVNQIYHRAIERLRLHRRPGSEATTSAVVHSSARARAMDRRAAMERVRELHGRDLPKERSLD